MIKLENGLERKKVYFLLQKDVMVLQGKLKIKQRVNIWKKWSNIGMAHPT